MTSNPFELAELLGPKNTSAMDNGFGLVVPAMPKRKWSPNEPESGQQSTAAQNVPVASDVPERAVPSPDVPMAGTPADVAAMHGYMAAGPEKALPNLAPIPFLAQALFGHTSGQGPIPYFAQHVLGLGPPGTPIDFRPRPEVAPQHDLALVPPGVESEPLAPLNGGQ